MPEIKQKPLDAFIAEPDDNLIGRSAHMSILVYVQQSRNISRSKEQWQRRNEKQGKAKGASKGWAHDEKVQKPVMKAEGR